MSRPNIDRKKKESGFINLKPGQQEETSSLPKICERERFYRELRGYDKKTLAAMLGIGGNAVSNWEAGRARPDVGLIPDLCRALNITMYQLFGEEEPVPQYSDSEKKLIKQYRSLSRAHRYVVDKLTDSLVVVEQASAVQNIKELFLFDRPLAAGVGDPTELEEEGSPIYLYDSPEVRIADYVFVVNGESMEPEYHSGDKVLVQKVPDAPELEYGEVGAFMIGNEMYIKVYEEDGLHSLNPSFASLRFDEEEAVYLIGRVVGIVDQEPTSEEIERFLEVNG